MNIDYFIWIIIGIVVVMEAFMELIKFNDPLKKLKRWYAAIAMALAIGLSGVCYLAALFKGVWALVFVVGLIAYAIQHFMGDQIVKRIKALIEKKTA